MAASGIYDSLASITGAIVFCVLHGVPLIPVIAIAIISLAKVPTGPLKDPLRGPFIWLRSSFLVFSLHIVTQVLYVILYYLINHQDLRILRVGLYFSVFADLFYYLTILLVNLTLLYVAIAFLYLAEGETKLHQFAKLAGLALTLITSALDIACWGMYLYTLSRVRLYYYFRGIPGARECRHAAAFLSWILSLAIASLSVMAFAKTKRRTDLGNLPQILLGANFVWLVGTTYLAATIIQFYVGEFTYGEFMAWYIIQPIFTTWTTFIVLVLVFFIGKRRVGGLWLQAQKHDSQQPITVAGTPVMGQAVYANQVPAAAGYNTSQQP